MPTLSQFYQFTNELGSSPLVLRHLQTLYADGFLDEKTPIELFSEISVVLRILKHFFEYSTFPQYLVPGTEAPILPNPLHLRLTNSTTSVYDAYYNPPAPSDRISPNYEIYQEACSCRWLLPDKLHLK